MIKHTFKFGNSVWVFADIKRNCKLLASSEDGAISILLALKRFALVTSNFKIVVEFDDIVVRNFGDFFLICEAGILELYRYKRIKRIIRKVRSKSISFSVTPEGNSASFSVESDSLLHMCSFKHEHDED